MAKVDPAHRATEKRIEEIERKIRKEYSEAEHGVQLRLQEHWGAFQIKDEKKRELVKAGKLSEEEYQHWRTGQIAVGKRWEDMRKTIAQDFMNANNIARKIADDSKVDVFAINGNYAFYEIERRAGIDMSFSLYNHESVIRLIRDNPDVLPPLSRYGENNAVKRAIREGRIQAWEEGKIQSALTQGILQGMSTAQLTKHISEHVGALNESYARRYARTAITGAQNAGRYESFRRAKKLGVDLVIEWNAILDRRTRRTHRHMHGERHEVDEPFEIDGHEILYPGYPLALDELIWNCRCTLLSWVRGYEPETVKESPGMEGMTFEEWQNAKGAKEYTNDNNPSSIGDLVAPVRPRKSEFNGNNEQYDIARNEYRKQRELYNEQLDKAVKLSSENIAFKSEKQLLDWASKNNITIDNKVIEQIDLRAFNEVAPTLDEMFKRFPEVKNFEAQSFSGEIVRFNFGIGLTDDGLLSANGGFNFNPRMFSNYESGLRDALESIADGTFVRGDGSFRTTVRHEYGHNVQNYIEFGLRDKYKQGADDWRINFQKFEDWQEANKMYREEYKRYNKELLSLAGLNGSSDYSNTNTLELFAEGFAEWSSGGVSEFATEFGKFFKRWY